MGDLTTAALAALGSGAVLAWLAAGLRALHPVLAGLLGGGVAALWAVVLGEVEKVNQ